MKIKSASVGAAAMLLAAAMVALPSVGSAEMKEIDCASSPFKFEAEGFQVDCERSTSQVRAGESSGGTQIDVMTISGQDPRLFITVVSIQINAPRIYLEHRDLRSAFRDTFEGIDLQDWNGVGNKGGYDSAEFTSVISGLSSSCVAIRRYSNPAWTGFKRQVVGMACSPVSRDPVYDALTKLHAPGG